MQPCPNCQRMVTPGATDCAWCGTVLARQEPAAPQTKRNWLRIVGIGVASVLGAAVLSMALAGLPCAHYSEGTRGCAAIHPVRDALFLFALLGGFVGVPALLLAALVDHGAPSFFPRRSTADARVPWALVRAGLCAALGGYLAYAAAHSHAFASFVPAPDQLVTAQTDIERAGTLFVGQPFGATRSVDFYLRDREVWRYPSHLPRYADVERLAGSDAGPLTLRASPRAGEYGAGDSIRHAHVRRIFEVWRGSHRLVSYDEVVAAEKGARYPALFYVGLALVALGVLLGMRWANARRPRKSVTSRPDA